jgi:Flp pilus assembly protein TadD
VLASCLWVTERQLPYWRDSVTLFTHAAAVTHDNALARANLGFALFENGRFDDAMVELNHALEIQPSHVDAHNNLGVVLFRKHRVDDAIAHFDTALKLKPNHAGAHHNLANALLRRGDAAGAIQHYETAIRLKPDHAEAKNNLAWVLATCPDASLRNGPRALELAREAVALSDPPDPAILGTLAAAYAETGQFAEAQRTLAFGQTNAALSDALQVQLRSYQAGRPFRDAP